jgi:hypothetical protein
VDLLAVMGGLTLLFHAVVLAAPTAGVEVVIEMQVWLLMAVVVVHWLIRIP